MRRSLKKSLIIQKTFVITYQHLGFNLFHCFKNNAHDNDKAGSCKGYGCAEHTIEYKRYYTDDCQTNRTDEDNVIQNPGQVLAGRLSGSDTGDKATLLFHVFCNLNRIEGNGCIEVCKEHNQYNIKE